LPDVLQLLYTNGDFLKDIRYENLVRAGISFFIVTRHESSDFPGPSQKVVKSRDLTLSNRGGLMKNVQGLRLSLPCYAPSDMLIVTVTGDVLLCFDDAARTQVMGNVAEQAIEVLYSPVSRRPRRR
jgi:2-deoxy-scyllo-inosamine dehydrogenase (SAM-dependent)